jgi:putative DNA methylase
MRTERTGRPRDTGSNALASSIVLACRPRADDAGTTDRRGFLATLKSDLPRALRELQGGNVAPVDLAQAAIGPGMAVFSRFAKVVEPDGSPMRVRTALGMINQVLDEVLAEQEGEFDADTRWAVAWFEQGAFRPGRFGEAETLSKAKVTSIDHLREAGIVAAQAGEVSLLRWDELDAARPTDLRGVSVWMLMQLLIRALDKEGEEAAARLLVGAGAGAQSARDLAYRLYVSADRRGWAVGVVGASEEWLPVFRGSGMRFAYLGDEAVVPVQSFSLAGGDMKGLRQACTRAERKGYRVEFLDPAHAGGDTLQALDALC